MEDKALHMSLLFDFFGELLTEKQKEYFDLYYNNDLSLSEIAENEGISRQGVRDIIIRAENTLKDTENKTGIVEKYLNSQLYIEQIIDNAEKIVSLNDSSIHSEQLDKLARTISERASSLKD